jgi:hypothetical protein
VKIGQENIKTGVQVLKFTFVFSAKIILLIIMALITLGSHKLLFASKESSGNKIFQIPFSSIDKETRNGVSDRKFIVIKTAKE